MPIGPLCPRCPRPARRTGRGWDCVEHGPVRPLWRAETAGYEEFALHLGRSQGMPTYLPWPLPPGWQVTGFATVGEAGTPVATLTSTTGTTARDGVVDLLVVTEEPGVGLGARVAGVPVTDPPVPSGRPDLRIEVDQASAALWLVAARAEEAIGASVLLGEAGGRWLWVVVRPGPAVLLLNGGGLLRDVSHDGPSLLELAFGGIEPHW